jgi:hypothetical protein
VKRLFNSTPVIQDQALVGHGAPRRDQFLNGTHNVGAFHVALGVVVIANEKDTGMMPVRFQYQVVQVLEVR